jgi:lipooligosaccharide transport system permease protein
MTVHLRELAPVRASTGLFARFREAGTNTLLVAIFNPIFVLGAMGLGLGSLISGDRAQSLGGVDYLAFLAPGLMAAFAMQGAAQESLWPVLGGIKWEGSYLAQAATTLRPVDILRGQMLYTSMRVGISTTMTFLAMVLFGAVESWWGVLAVPVALLTGLAYAAPITAFSATQQTDSAFPLIMRLGVIPSYLFSGTFFPITQLPGPLQGIAKVTPLWHGVDLCRSLSLGTTTFVGAVVHVSYLVVFVAVAMRVGTFTFTRRLHQ